MISDLGEGWTRLVALVLAVLIAVAGTAVAVTILSNDPNRIVASEGTLSSSSNLTVDSQSLDYTGTNATAVHVDVNNTDSSSHTVDVHFALRDSNDNVVDSTTNSSVSVSANSVKTVTWNFSNNHPVNNFQKVEVTVEETG